MTKLLLIFSWLHLINMDQYCDTLGVVTFPELINMDDHVCCMLMRFVRYFYLFFQLAIKFVWYS